MKKSIYLLYVVSLPELKIYLHNNNNNNNNKTQQTTKNNTDNTERDH